MNFVYIMRKTGLFIVVVLFLLNGCGKDKNEFTIKGNIKGASQTNIILAELTTKKMIVVDSVFTDKKGDFKITGNIDSPGFYVLRTQKSRFINLVLHPGDHIDLTTDLDNFDTEYYVEGSRDSRLVQELIKNQNKTLEKITTLSNEYEESKNDPSTYFDKKKSIDSTYNQLVAEYKDYSISFIHKYPESLASLMALYQQLGIHASVFNPVDDIDIFDFVDSNLTAEYPNVDAVKSLNEEVVDVKQRMKYQEAENSKLEEGTAAPEIALPDTSGEVVQLSSLQGKYVLVNFWASWSGPSKDFNNYLKQIYNKYKRRGLEIYQVSLDQSREAWTTAIKQEELPWINVSDLKYWNSVAVPLYNIYNLPASFLIDRSGKIVAKDLNKDDLDEKLKEIFHT